MPLPLSGPLTKQRASALSDASACGSTEAESKAKCASGMSPHAFRILSSMWIEPLVGVAVSFFAAAPGCAPPPVPALFTASAVFGGGGGSELHPTAIAAPIATSASASDVEAKVRFD